MMEASNKAAVIPAAALSRQTVVLDICERAFVFVVFSHFAWVMLSSRGLATNFFGMLLVVSEAIPFVLIMLHSRSETLSARPTNWLLGMAGGTLPLLVHPAAVAALGPYRFVRHPMYLGYTFTHIGFLLSMPTVTTALLYATTLAVQILRLLREEQVLMQDEAYRAFAKQVRFHLLPGVF
jgi:protein-S-isoprenylcysteine O-methyltransferase Ste14